MNYININIFGNVAALVIILAYMTLIRLERYARKSRSVYFQKGLYTGLIAGLLIASIIIYLPELIISI